MTDEHIFDFVTDENDPLNYVDFSEEHLAELNLSDELLAEIYFEWARENADTTLQLARNCYRRFGVELLSDEQKRLFEKIAKGTIPNDEELEILQDEGICAVMKTVREARERNRQASERLGEAYEPELTFQDKTFGFGVS